MTLLSVLECGEKSKVVSDMCSLVELNVTLSDIFLTTKKTKGTRARFPIRMIMFSFLRVTRSYDVIFITLASKALHMQGVYLEWATSVIREIIVRQIPRETDILSIDYPHFGIISTTAVAIRFKPTSIVITLRRNNYYRMLIISPLFARFAPSRRVHAL